MKSIVIRKRLSDKLSLRQEALKDFRKTFDSFDDKDYPDYSESLKYVLKQNNIDIEPELFTSKTHAFFDQIAQVSKYEGHHSKIARNLIISDPKMIRDYNFLYYLRMGLIDRIYIDNQCLNRYSLFHLKKYCKVFKNLRDFEDSLHFDNIKLRLDAFESNSSSANSYCLRSEGECAFSLDTSFPKQGIVGIPSINFYIRNTLNYNEAIVKLSFLYQMGATLNCLNEALKFYSEDLSATLIDYEGNYGKPEVLNFKINLKDPAELYRFIFDKNCWINLGDDEGNNYTERDYLPICNEDGEYELNKLNLFKFYLQGYGYLDSSLENSKRKYNAKHVRWEIRESGMQHLFFKYNFNLKLFKLEYLQEKLIEDVMFSRKDYVIVPTGITSEIILNEDFLKEYRSLIDIRYSEEYTEFKKVIKTVTENIVDFILKMPHKKLKIKAVPII